MYNDSDDSFLTNVIITLLVSFSICFGFYFLTKKCQKKLTELGIKCLKNSETQFEYDKCIKLTAEIKGICNE
jgi:hypothetical protein